MINSPAKTPSPVVTRPLAAPKPGVGGMPAPPPPPTPKVIAIGLGMARTRQIEGYLRKHTVVR